MIAFGHTALGSAIGIFSYQVVGGGSPVEGLLLTSGVGLLSHYLSDFIPHGHFFKGSYKEHVWPVLIYDLLLSLIIFLGIPFLFTGINEQFFYILFGVGFSLLPDVLDGLIYLRVIPNVGFFRLENNLHLKTHWHGAGNKALLWKLKRDLWQIAVIIFSLLMSIFHIIF